jgi:aryl sulfotransferase
MRRYQGFMVDSDRWNRFELRPDDIIISTPSKSGTTWMQQIVAMLVLDRTEHDSPLSTLSPWLDALVATDDEVFGLLADQGHRRFIKTHTPLDGVPMAESVTYLAVVRHPLDVALSHFDHLTNKTSLLGDRIRGAGDGSEAPPRPEAPLEDSAGYLRWWITDLSAPDGAGPENLADYCNSVRTYWSERHRPNVHLIHYTDLWNDLQSEIARIATALRIEIDDQRLGRLHDAATLESMRDSASQVAPFADLGDVWKSDAEFFRKGGTRDWSSLLDPDEVEEVERRMRAELGAEAAAWALGGSGQASRQ